MIDWSIRLGDVVSFLGFALGGLSVIFMMKGDIRALGMRLGFLEDTVRKETEAQNKKIDIQSGEIGKFAEVLALIGRYEERMLHMQREIDDLKRGRGYIRDGAAPA